MERACRPTDSSTERDQNRRRRSRARPPSPPRPRSIPTARKVNTKLRSNQPSRGFEPPGLRPAGIPEASARSRAISETRARWTARVSLRLRPPATRARPRPDVAPGSFRSSETMKKKIGRSTRPPGTRAVAGRTFRNLPSLHSQSDTYRCAVITLYSNSSHTHARTHARIRKMGVDIETLKPGDGVTFPKPGQVVTAHYTGAHRDASRENVKPVHGRRALTNPSAARRLPPSRAGFDPNLTRRRRSPCPPRTQ